MLSNMDSIEFILEVVLFEVSLPPPSFFFNPYDFHCFPFFGGVGESFIHKPFNFFFAGCWCLFLGRARTCGYSLDFIVCD